MSAKMKYGSPHFITDIGLVIFIYGWLPEKKTIALLVDISFRHNFFNSVFSFRVLSFLSPPYGKHIMALAQMSSKL